MLIDAMGMKSCNDERIANGYSAAYPDSVFTASAGEILNESIDWEQRRYELAKAAMQGLLANYHNSNINIHSLAEDASDCADVMIGKLQEGGEEWHEFKSWYDGAKYGEHCIFRYEVLDNGTVISDYITAIWNDTTCDYLSDRISEYFEDYKITHWKPIIKPKGVEE